MAIILRPLTPENAAECLALSLSEEEMNHSLLGTMDEIIQECLDDDACISLAIYSDDTVVGFLDYTPFAELTEYHINHFLIDGNHRRRGYGEASLRLLIIDLCEKPDCARIALNYMSFNDTGAIELYNKVGFVEKKHGDEKDDSDCFAVLDCANYV